MRVVAAARSAAALSGARAAARAVRGARPRPARAMAAAAGGGLISSKDFFLDTFALRQWDDADYKGSRISHDKADFVARVQAARDAGAELTDGYAPFCKHIFVPNVVGAKVGSLPITDVNRALVRHGYEARTDYELAVLCRWFDESEVGELPEAKWLDIILYSREQVRPSRACDDRRRGGRARG